MKNKTTMIALMATSILLAGCGGGGGYTGGNTGGGEGGGKFTLQIFAGGYGTSAWQYALKLFEKDHPEYEINVNMDNNVNEQFANRWKRGNPPDFVFLDGTQDRDTWLKEGLLEDLSEWSSTALVPGENVKVGDKINPAYWRTYTDEKGKTISYGAPLILNAYGMWYDEALFEEKGFSMPSNYNELKSFANTVKADSSGMRTLIYPGKYSGYLTQGLLVPAFAELGDEIFDRIMNCKDVEVYKTPEFKSIIQRFADFIQTNDHVVADCISADHTGSQMRWLKHEAALIPNGLWLRGEMEKDIPEGFRMRYAPSPLVQKQQYIVTTSITCGVAKEASNKKAAKEFMTYLYRDDVQKQFAYASDSPVAAKVDFTNDNKVSDVLAYTQSVFNDPAFKHASNNGSWGGVDKAINDGVNTLVDNPSAVDTVINNIVAAATKELSGK